MEYYGMYIYSQFIVYYGWNMYILYTYIYIYPKNNDSDDVCQIYALYN